MEGLGPVGQCGAQLAGSAAELLQQHLAKARIGALDLDVVHKFLAVEEHPEIPLMRNAALCVNAVARLSLPTGLSQTRFPFPAPRAGRRVECAQLAKSRCLVKSRVRFRSAVAGLQ